MEQNSTSAEIYREALRNIESDIEHSGQAYGVFTRRIFLNAKPSVYVRLKKPEGLPGLIFEVAPLVVKSLKLSQSTRGFIVSTDLTQDVGGRKVCSVVVSLNDVSFEELFSEFAGHLLDHITTSASEKEAMISLQLQLQLWKRFLDKGVDSGLSINEQTGLYGELSFARRCLNEKILPIDVLNAWTGPSGSNQDFTFGSVAVEVKSSSANDANIVKISNLRQLDGTGLQQLYIYHCALDRRQLAGETLPDIILDLALKFAESDKVLSEMFYERLMAAGYLRSHADLYRDTGYVMRYDNGYRVDDAFPRILEMDVPSGISDVKFMVDLDCAAQCLIKMTEILDEIKEIK